MEQVNGDDKNSDDSSVNLETIRRGRKKRIIDYTSKSSTNEFEIDESNEKNKDAIYCGHCKKTFKNSQELEKAHMGFRKLTINISPEEQENAMLEYYAQQGDYLFSIVSDDETVVN